MFFEYQTLICQLTGMDVSNASLYDGGSAVAEAVLMAMQRHRPARPRRHRRERASRVSPDSRTPISPTSDTELVTVGTPDGIDRSRTIWPRPSTTKRPACSCSIRTSSAAWKTSTRLVEVAHDAGALFVVIVDPISLGLLKRPGDYGADIAVAEGQSLGSPMSYGGPYLGIMACREQFVRRMPGRIAGQTVDRRGKRCWVLTLQTREQHIRREKATSNICTNQGLFALRATRLPGRAGPARPARRRPSCACAKRTTLRSKLTAGNRLAAAPSIGRCSRSSSLRDTSGRVDELLADALDAGFFAGVPLGRWYPELADCFLVCVTEKRTRDEIDGLAACHRTSNATRKSPLMRNTRATQLLFELSKPGPPRHASARVRRARDAARRSCCPPSALADSAAAAARSWPSPTSCATSPICRRRTCRSTRTSIRSARAR